jgi:hypothetical protein
MTMLVQMDLRISLLCIEVCSDEKPYQVNTFCKWQNTLPTYERLLVGQGMNAWLGGWLFQFLIDTDRGTIFTDKESDRKERAIGLSSVSSGDTRQDWQADPELAVACKERLLFVHCDALWLIVLLNDKGLSAT